MALYLWDTKNEKWEKPEVEGTLFVYRFVLLNVLIEFSKYYSHIHGAGDSFHFPARRDFFRPRSAVSGNEQSSTDR